MKWWSRAKHEPHTPEFTGSCPIREHTGDGNYCGRCEFATYDMICPRHGHMDDYPDNDDRAILVKDRRFE